MRYTLDESNTIKRYGGTLCNVLDNGTPTEAYAKSNVVFSDKCEISGGWFHGGEFRGGEFRGGEFHGGEFRGGEFHGGEFRGGWFRGGEFRGGWLRGGEFHGGEFHGGWLPLQIQGSSHFVNVPDGANIKIGCQEHGVDYWLKNYERIGKIEGYSDEQIVEYKLYIDLAAALIERNK